MKAIQHSLAHKHIPCLHGNYNRKHTICRKQSRDGLKQRGKRKRGCIACPAPALIWRQSTLGIIRRIAQNQIEAPRLRFLCQHPDIELTKLHPVCERTLKGILGGFLYTGFVYINTQHLGMRTTLCRHQRNNTASATDIKYKSLSTGTQNLNVCPCPKQHRIGAHTHGTSMVANLEFPEPKCLSCHNRETNLLLFCQQGAILPEKKRQTPNFISYLPRFFVTLHANIYIRQVSKTTL